MNVFPKISRWHVHKQVCDSMRLNRRHNHEHSSMYIRNRSRKTSTKHVYTYISKKVCLTVTHIRKKKHPHQKFNKNTNNWNMQQSSSHPFLLASKRCSKPLLSRPRPKSLNEAAGMFPRKVIGIQWWIFGGTGFNPRNWRCLLYIYIYKLLVLNNISW